MIISPISLTVLMRFAHKTDNNARLSPSAQVEAFGLNARLSPSAQVEAFGLNARLSPSAQVEAFGLNARPHVALLFQFEKANPNKRDTK